MREATEEDKKQILQFLQMDLKNCIYLYIDIMNYGVCSENMKVWIDMEGEEMSLVVMKYYDSFQIYSRQSELDSTAVAELLKKYPVAMISGRRDLMEQLAKECPDYKATYGVVFVMDRYRNMQAKTEILRATEADAEEIAELICSDDELGRHYTVEGLATQLRDRIGTGTGRSYIIRENGVIVAHTATYAEAEGIAVVSGTIIKPECRNKNYYILISNYMMEQLAKEGKTAYTFSISEKMIQYHDKLHAKCGEYGKLVKM